MKKLTNYTQDALTELFKSCNAFWAFSQAQFQEAMIPHIYYCACGGGLYCNTEKTQELVDGMERIIARGIVMDMAENGAEAIIRRELANHECYYTGSPADCIDVLTDYPIDNEQIIEVWNLERRKEENYA